MLELRKDRPHQTRLQGSITTGEFFKKTKFGKLDRVDSRGYGSTHNFQSVDVSQLSSNSERKLLLHLNLNGRIANKPCVMIVDTASDITLANTLFFEKEINNLEKVSKHLKILTVSRASFPFKSIRKALVQIGNISIELEIVFADIQEDCILGLDFLHKSGLLTEFETLINKKFNLQRIEKTVSVTYTNSNKANDEIPEYLIPLFENSTKQLNPEQIAQFKVFISRLSDIFARNSNDLGVCDYIKHKIDTGNNKPFKLAPRRIPIHYRDAALNLLEEMKTQGVIEPSSSPYASPPVFIPKKKMVQFDFASTIGS